MKYNSADIKIDNISIDNISLNYNYKNKIIGDEIDHFKPLKMNYKKIFMCPDNHINCLTAKEWIKKQIGVWEFFYEKRDIRDKEIHPATFPIAPQKML